MLFEIAAKHLNEAREELAKFSTLEDRHKFIKDVFGDSMINVIKGTSLTVRQITFNAELSLLSALAIHSVILPLWVANERCLPELEMTDLEETLLHLDYNLGELPESWQMIVAYTFKNADLDSKASEVALLATHETLRTIWKCYVEADKSVESPMGI